MFLILFEPEIPQNAGTLARLCKCFNMKMGIIEPASFLLSDRKFKRARMDYIDSENIIKYQTFWKMKETNKNSRIILLDTKANTNYFNINYKNSDILMVGRESSGVPDNIFSTCDITVKIPMMRETRSLNVALSASIVVSEAQRQLGYNFNK